MHVFDAIFPNQLLLPAIADFAKCYPGTRVELVESVMSGAPDLVRHGRVQLAVTPHVPQGWLGDHLIRLEFACVASPATLALAKCIRQQVEA